MANPLKDIKVKIGGKEIALGELGRGEPISFDGQTLVSRRSNGSVAVGTIFDGNREESRSKTIQSEASETDINLIIAKAINGNALMVNQREPRYGDFSSGFNYHENAMRIKDFESNFERLPSTLRARFDNDPAKLIEFSSDPANENEAIKLGILPKKAVVPEVPPVVTPEAPVTPVVP